MLKGSSKIPRENRFLEGRFKSVGRDFFEAKGEEA